MAKTGTRWIPVTCLACHLTHGVTTGAAILAITAGQSGELVTTGGTPVCFLDAIRDNVREANGKSNVREVAFVMVVE